MGQGLSQVLAAEDGSSQPCDEAWVVLFNHSRYGTGGPMLGMFWGWVGGRKRVTLTPGDVLSVVAGGAA